MNVLIHATFSQVKAKLELTREKRNIMNIPDLYYKRDHKKINKTDFRLNDIAFGRFHRWQGSAEFFSNS